MIYYLRETYPDMFERVTSDVTVGEGNDAITHPFDNLARYDAEQLSAIGVHAVHLIEPDAGNQIVSSTFARVDGAVVNVIVQESLPIVVPESVTNAQAKIALVDAGLYQQVVAAVSAGDIRLGIWFSNSQTWERDNAYVAALGQGLGLNAAAIDALFVAAAQVR